MIKIPVKSASPACLSLCAAAALVCFSLPGHASKLTATADIKGCTDASISGRATFKEKVTDEGIKEVTIHLKVKGLSDGKHAVHIHESAACEPCGAAKGHHDPGPFGQTRPDSAGDLVPADDANDSGWPTQLLVALRMGPDRATDDRRLGSHYA